MYGGRKGRWEAMRLETVQGMIAEPGPDRVCRAQAQLDTWVLGEVALAGGPVGGKVLPRHAPRPPHQRQAQGASAGIFIPSFLWTIAADFLTPGRTPPTMNLMKKLFHTQLQGMARNEMALADFLTTMDALSQVAVGH